MPLGREASWQDEWQALVRRSDQAVARSRALQAAITDVLRRRQPPPRDLLREAERAEDELAALKAQLRAVLRQVS
jgi:seryl-tRNA synthetase